MALHVTMARTPAERSAWLFLGYAASRCRKIHASCRRPRLCPAVTQRQPLLCGKLRLRGIYTPRRLRPGHYTPRRLRPGQALRQHLRGSPCFRAPPQCCNDLIPQAPRWRRGRTRFQRRQWMGTGAHRGLHQMRLEWPQDVGLRLLVTQPAQCGCNPVHVPFPWCEHVKGEELEDNRAEGPDIHGIAVVATEPCFRSRVLQRANMRCQSSELLRH